jgi:hypothetical protein
MPKIVDDSLLTISTAAVGLSMFASGFILIREKFIYYILELSQNFNFQPLATKSDSKGYKFDPFTWFQRWFYIF